MALEPTLWLMPALLALAGSWLAVWPGRLHHRVLHQHRRWLLIATLAAAAADIACLVGSAVAAGAWPGALLPERLALLALGALLTLAGWIAFLSSGGTPPPASSLPSAQDAAPYAAEQPVSPEWGAGALLASVAVLLVAAAIPAWTASAAEMPAAGAWLFGLTQIVAGMGLGSLLTAFALSAATRRAPLVPQIGELPPGLSAVHVPALDGGRGAALFGYPWLTVAWVLIGVWNLASHATVWRAEAGELWLFAAWLLAAAYLHLTSSWRPLRLPGWLPTLAAGLAFAAALFATIAGGSL